MIIHGIQYLIIVPLVKKFEMGTGKPDKTLDFLALYGLFSHSKRQWCVLSLVETGLETSCC